MKQEFVTDIFLDLLLSNVRPATQHKKLKDPLFYRKRTIAYRLRRDGMTWKEIGAVIGVSSERARQMFLTCSRQIYWLKARPKVLRIRAYVAYVSLVSMEGK